MSWAHYLVQVNIYLVIFYCFYQLLLAQETYFIWNRIYLVSSGMLSLAIPFLKFEWFSKKVVSNQLYKGVYELNNIVTNYTLVPQTQEQYDWGRLIVIVYLVGAMFFIAKFAYQLFAVNKLLKTVNPNTAFSFFNKKAVSNKLPATAIVHLHEDVHVKQLHTVDVLFFELIGIITWFNPIIYSYKTAVKNIHEYLADEAAARFQGDKELYSMLLLSQAFGIKPSQLTNGFFTKSMIKKRIFMLHKQRSKRTAILKYGLFFPLFTLALVLSSASIRKNDQLLAVTAKIPLNEANSVVNNAIISPLSIINLASRKETVASAATITSIPQAITNKKVADEENRKAWKSLYTHLGRSIRYPADAIGNKLQGASIIRFAIKNEAVINLIIDNELGLGCDQEVIKNISNYKGIFPQDGDYTLKTIFKLEGWNGPMKNAEIRTNGNTGEIVISAYAPKEDDNTIYNFVALENPPTYPGGLNKFYEYLSKTIRYPETAMANGIEGNVFVSFTVEKDGALSGLKVERKLGYGVDEEALRVLKLSDKWNPGLLNGEPIRVKYHIPIKFSIANKPKETADKPLTLREFNKGKEPLYVIDGKAQTSAAIQHLNPNGIESISVLKDELAINSYGTRAQHGVILIKTKAAKVDLNEALIK